MWAVHESDQPVANFRVLRQPHPSGDQLPARPMVCLLGHSTSPLLARALALRWRPLHSFWSISGPSNASVTNFQWAFLSGGEDMFNVWDPSGQGNLHMQYCPPSECSPKQGMTKALALARASSVPCEYFLLIDGDQEWRLNSRFVPLSPNRDVTTELSTELLRTLASWKPAVLGFAAEPSRSRLGVGAPRAATHPDADADVDAVAGGAAPLGERRDVDHPDARLQRVFIDDPVCPLTAVKSDTVYHASVIDFVLPLPVNGEGGFYSNRTLPLLWLSALMPVMFQHNAIQLNSIYHLHPQPVQGPNDDVVSAQESRVRTAYLDFLRSGFKALSTPGELALEDVDWRPRIGVPPYHPSLLERLNRVISQSHPAVAQSVDHFASSAPTARPKIIVLAQSTPGALSRCLAALNRALYHSSYSVELEVVLVQTAGLQAAGAIARRFQWTRGQYSVRKVSSWGMAAVKRPHDPKHPRPRPAPQQTQHKSTADASVVPLFSSLWHPVQRTEVALLLDDTVEVSPYFFQWMLSCYTTAVSTSRSAAEPLSNHILGCALTSPPPMYDDVLASNHPGPSVWLQDASSPALVVHPRQWRAFVAWLGKPATPHPELPGSAMNVWPVRALLRRYLSRFAVESGAVVAYPNMLSHSLAVASPPLSLSPAELAAGTFEPFPDVPPLLSRSAAKLSGDHVPPSVLQVRASSNFADWTGVLMSANILSPYPLSKYDKLTIVMPGYARPGVLLGTVKHYCALPILEELVVVWNNLERSPPTIRAGAGRCKIRVVRQTENSLHNRFRPLPDIKTVAVFSVDDDVRLELDAVVRAFRTWQMFPERVVGFIPTARGAAIKPGSVSTLEYHKSYPEYIEQYRPPECPYPGRVNDMNFILTGGAIFDEKFLFVYTRSTDAAMVRGRSLVTKYFNGEDILFAFMHAHETKQNPIVVKANWDMKLMAGAPGLHKRVGHFSNRARLLNDIAAVFGEFPLLPLQGYNWPETGAPHLITCDTPITKKSAKVRGLP